MKIERFFQQHIYCEKSMHAHIALQGKVRARSDKRRNIIGKVEMRRGKKGKYGKGVLIRLYREWKIRSRRKVFPNTLRT